jgi:hypothetical protein
MIRDCILNGILPITSLERVDTAIEHLITKVGSDRKETYSEA